MTRYEKSAVELSSPSTGPSTNAIGVSRFRLTLRSNTSKAVIIADDVVKLLGLDALRDVDFLVKTRPSVSDSVSLMI